MRAQGGRNQFLNPKSGGRPVAWVGGPTKYTIWQAKLMADYRMMGGPRVDSWVKRAQVQKEPITSVIIELEFGDDAETVKHVPAAFHRYLTMHPEGGPFCKMENITQRNGLDAIRFTMGRYEPRTAQSKRVYLRNIMPARQAK